MPKEKKEKPKDKTKVPGLAGGQRVKDMSATATIVEEPTAEELARETPAPKEKEKKLKIKQRGKRYKLAKKLVDSSKIYTLKEALLLLKKMSLAKFNGSVEVHLNVLEKGLSGEVSLPYFKGKERKIVVFTDQVGEKIKAGKIDFEVLLASPADMPKILPLAKILGPKGLMPNPKNGTLVPDPKKAQEKFATSAFYFKTEKDFPIIHTIIGKLNQPEQELAANFEALIKAIGPPKIKKAVLKSTMSPGIKVSLS